MKANELMIGDWVHFIDLEDCMDKDIQWTAEDYIEINDDFCNPIPLTDDILKANGWSNENSCLFWREDIGVMNYNGSYHICRINNVKLHYVHELQRALRCCGLFDLANNFKI